ncbi:MAG: hypothetical protein ACERKD_18455 [Prolixibacteraceae bacterium]
MNSTEIKNKIIQHIEFFDDSQLEIFYGVLLSFIDSQSDSDGFSNMSQKETNGNSMDDSPIDKRSKAEHEQSIRDLKARYRKY